MAAELHRCLNPQDKRRIVEIGLARRERASDERLLHLEDSWIQKVIRGLIN